MNKLLILFFIFYTIFLPGTSTRNINQEHQPELSIKRAIEPTNSILNLESVTVAEVSTVYYNYNNQFRQYISCNSYVDVYYDNETNLIKAFNINLNWYLSELSTGNNNINLKSVYLNGGTYYRNIDHNIMLNELTGARIYLAVDNALSDNATNDALDTTLRFTFQYNATTINWTDIDINTNININNYIDADYYDAQGRLPYVRNISPGFVISNYSFTDFNYDVGYNDGYTAGETDGYNNGYVAGQESSKWNDVLTIIEEIFNMITRVLSVELLPNIKLLYIVAIPLILAVVKWILDWFR